MISTNSPGNGEPFFLEQPVDQPQGQQKIGLNNPWKAGKIIRK
jgi:hypothetical protein